MAKTGAQHLKSLQDGRCVYLNGKLVDDVTTHPIKMAWHYRVEALVLVHEKILASEGFGNKAHIKRRYD